MCYVYFLGFYDVDSLCGETPPLFFFKFLIESLFDNFVSFGAWVTSAHSQALLI